MSLETLQSYITYSSTRQILHKHFIPKVMHSTMRAILPSNLARSYFDQLLKSQDLLSSTFRRYDDRRSWVARHHPREYRCVDNEQIISLPRSQHRLHGRSSPTTYPIYLRVEVHDCSASCAPIIRTDRARSSPMVRSARARSCWNLTKVLTPYDAGSMRLPSLPNSQKL
jgi:hypothetical protein